jgi:shikimate dehydrogenase
VVVVNRTRERAEQAAALAGGRGVVVQPDEVGDAVGAATVVVQATSVGLGVDPGTAVQALLPAGVLGPDHCVLEMIYHPAETAFLAAARQAGAAAVNGVGMLVHQAAAAFEWWTGVPAPLDAMTAAAVAGLRR